MWNDHPSVIARRRRTQRHAIAALLLLAALNGCRRAEAPDAQPAPMPTNTVVDELLAEAPRGHDPFVRWADRQLRERPATVPAPAAQRIEPRWPVVRLTDLFDTGDVRSDRAASEREPEPLATLGPANSRVRDPSYKLDHSTTRRGAGQTTVRFENIPVSCRMIGRIEIRIHARAGRNVELAWSRAGRVRVPLPGNDRAWTISLSTDGFSEWKGLLKKLEIIVEESAQATFDIEWVKLYGRSAAYPEAADVARVSLGREMRTAIYAHAPVEFEIGPLRVPRNGRLQLGLGKLVASDDDADAAQDEPQRDAAPRRTPTVAYEIEVLADGARETVLNGSVEYDSTWEDVEVDLAKWSDRQVTLRLAASGPAENAVAFWSNPLLYEPIDEPPCVILYLIDTLSSKHINLYGYHRETMPKLTAFASEGAWFANMVANSPVTVSSVKDLLLSMPAARHGVYSYSLQAPQHLVPLPEALAAAGVATAMFSTNVNAGPAQRTDRGFDMFFDRIAFRWNAKADRTVPIEDVIRWMSVHRDRPMFVYVHTAEPHAPYRAPQPFRNRYQTEGADHEFVARYDEEVAYADARFGAFVAALEAAGLADRAHILVTADHGEELNEHGSMGHGKSMYQEVLGIPLVLRGPRVVARGRIDVPAQLFDLMPTILDLFDTPEPQPTTGESLAPLLSGSPPPGAARTVISSFAEARGQGLIEWVINENARWKLMFVKNTSPGARGPQGKMPAVFELYDLRKDPGERRNVIERHPDVARRLISSLIEYIHEQAPFAAQQESEALEFDVQQIRELRNLGYVE